MAEIIWNELGPIDIKFHPDKPKEVMFLGCPEMAAAIQSLINVCVQPPASLVASALRFSVLSN
jgi:hypothetical protein